MQESSRSSSNWFLPYSRPSIPTCTSVGLSKCTVPLWLVKNGAKTHAVRADASLLRSVCRLAASVLLVLAVSSCGISSQDGLSVPPFIFFNQ